MELLRHLLPILLVLTVISADVIATVTTNLPNGSSEFAILKGTAIAVVADICDNYGSFNCPTGTCYTGNDGFVGCCSVASCAARTACFPYDSKVSHSCNVDIDGCIACSSGAPACVTVSNMVNNQYIMYCDSSATKVILSYTNLITTGSMALPPMSRTASIAPITATNSSASSDTYSRVPTTTPITATPASNTTQTKDFQVSRGAVAGITVGSVIGLTSIIFLLGFLHRRRRISAEASKFAEAEKSPGLFDPDYSKGYPAEMITPRRLQKPPTSRGGPIRDRMAVHSSGDHNSLSVGELLAREAEHRTTALFPHGINRSDYAPTSPSDMHPSPEIGQGMRRGNWRPTPPIPSPHQHGQAANRPYHTSSGVVQNDIAELPNSSIRYVQPSRSFSTPDLPSLTTATFDRDPHSSTQVEAASSTYSSHSNPISPNASSFVATPFLRGVSPPTTPLLGHWTSDRSSVGQITTNEDTSTRQGQSERPSFSRRPIDVSTNKGAAVPQSQQQDHDHDLVQDRASARVTGPLSWPSGMHTHNQSNGQSPLSQVDGPSTSRSPAMTGNRSGLVRNGVKRNRDGSPRIGTGQGRNIRGRPHREGVARSLTSATGFSSGASGGRGGYVTAEAAMAGADLAADEEFAP